MGRVFAHADEAATALGGRRKVQMRELADRVPHRLVGHALGPVAPVDVGEVDAADAGCRRGRERFDAVAQYEHDVGRQVGDHLADPRNTARHRRDIRLAAGLTFALHAHLRVDRDIRHGYVAPCIGGEMHTRDDGGQIERRARIDRAHDRQQDPKVRPAAGHHENATLLRHLCFPP